ncbi:MAG: phage tail sheath subtilisin-like domain-containing protein [Rubrivivax sp.]|nr:phage tail sheath subtilisin-like domain-containing protein [Rubrivivax sp.]
MAALDRIAHGAPGVYTLAPEPIRRLTGVRMDVCAFVGVAPRGPCRQPLVDNTAALTDDWRMCDPLRPRVRSVAVAVESFDEYRRQFGGYEGPGLLPYAVAAYFEQGAQRAHVVRIVHRYASAADNAAGVASAALGGVLGAPLLRARSEGSWGNALQARLGFRTRALQAQPIGGGTLELRLNPAEPIAAGTLLRLRLVDGSHVLRFITALADRGDPNSPARQRIATLESATAAAVATAELVDAQLRLSDGAGSSEVFIALGLHVDHPRWLATVLCRESRLAWPDFAWAGDRLSPTGALQLVGEHAAAPFSGGIDRFADIDHEDFFDPGFDPHEDGPYAGLHCLLGVDELTQLCAPDLYQPQPLPAQSGVPDPSLAGPDFALCTPPPPAAVVQPNAIALPGLALDPAAPADLERITALLLRVQTLVEDHRDLIALLDVPPGLKPAQVAALRSHFDSSYCAAYHPWLQVATSDDARAALVSVPPSAAAAGILAARERRQGIAHGPANEVAREVVKPLARISPAQHDLLHPLGINVYLQEPAGVRLSAARTLSLDPAWRQLSVRRLMLMLRRTLLRQMQWAVFEPHTPALRRELVRLVTLFLRRLYRLGAFSGATEEEAFFVHCDAELNPAYRVDNGQLLAHIGVAPSEPLEFIVLRFTRGGDGTLALEE